MNANQKCLIAISLILFFVISAVTTGLIVGDGDYSVLKGAIPFLIITAIPSIQVWFELRKKRRPRKRARFVVATTPPSAAYSKVDVFAGERLPHLCATCGQKTTSTTSLKFKAGDTKVSKYSLTHVSPFLAVYIAVKVTALAIWAFFYVQLERLLGSIRGSKNSLIFQIPQCRTCSEKYPIHRHHFDFHGRMMTIFARNNLVEAINRIRATDEEDAGRE